MKAFRAFGAAFALVLLGALAQANISPFWGTQAPSTNGPWLGDSNFNINTLYLAHERLAGHGYAPSLSVSQTSAQANCTQLGNDGFQQIATSAAAGYVCLPTAQPGKAIMIANATGQTINLYSSATGYAGTADNINGTVGTTAYTGLTTGKTAICFVPAANNWYCGAIS